MAKVNIANLTPFRRTYGLADFGIIADVTVQPGDFGKVGSLTVPAQQVIGFGFNDLVSGGVTGNPLYVRFDDTSGDQLHGKVRLVVSNANGTRTQVVYEGRTERLSADKSDRNKAVLLPLSMPLAQQDDKLIISMYPDSGSAIVIDYNGTNTSILIPATVYQ